MYLNRTGIAKMFDVSLATVARRVTGIESEMGKRYNNYAVLDRLESVAVYADYEKYHKLLDNKNTRKYVPDFNMQEAQRYIIEREKEVHTVES